MEEQDHIVPTDMPEEAIDPTICFNCKSKPFEEGFPTKLCADCRAHFIKYPIPKWIWIFAAAILIIMIIGMIRMPKYVSAAYHLSKAEKAIEHKQFLTAQRELIIVFEKFPDNLDVNANLLIAAAHNHNFVLSSVAYHRIEGKEIKDDELFKNLQSSIELVGADFPEDTTLINRIIAHKDSTEAMMNIYDHLAFKDNVDQNVAGVYIASMLYDRELYTEADKLLSKVLLNRTGYYPALTMLASVKRSLKEYDMAIAICDRLLDENTEDVSVIAQKSRIELKRNQDDKAAEYAAQAMRINPEDTYALEAQAMVDYYANRKAECTKLIAKIKVIEEGGDHVISNRLEQIITGKISYR